MGVLLPVLLLPQCAVAELETAAVPKDEARLGIPSRDAIGLLGVGKLPAGGHAPGVRPMLAARVQEVQIGWFHAGASFVIADDEFGKGWIYAGQVAGEVIDFVREIVRHCSTRPPP